MTEAEVFDKIVQERRAIRKYDETKAIPSEVVERSLKRAVLSPSSSNMQLYEFYRIRKKEDLQRLSKYCMGQGAATTASEMVIAVVRTDKYRERARHNHTHLAEIWKGKNDKRFRRVDNYYRRLMPLYYFTDPFGLVGLLKKIFIFFVGLRRPVVREVGKTDIRVSGHKSLALAVQTFMLSIQAEGYGSCPMEGIDSKRIKKWLKLPRRAQINMVISVGSPKMPEAIYNERLRVPYEEVVFEKK